MLKKYKKKNQFSNSLLHLMNINQIICMYFIPSNGPQNQFLDRIIYVYEPLRGRPLFSIYCDHAKTALIDCCLSLSDHLAVLVTRKKKAAYKERIELSGRSYNNYVRADFQTALVNLDWGPFYDNQEPDDL